MTTLDFDTHLIRLTDGLGPQLIEALKVATDTTAPTIQANRELYENITHIVLQGCLKEGIIATKPVDWAVRAIQRSAAGLNAEIYLSGLSKYLFEQD